MKNTIYTLAFLLGFGIVSSTAQDISLTNTKLDAPPVGQEYGKACFTIISENGIELTDLPLAVEISLSQVDFDEDGVFGFNSNHFDFEVDEFSNSVLRATLISTIPDVDNGGGGAQICIPVSSNDYSNSRNGFTVNIVPGGVSQNGATSNDYIERFGYGQNNQSAFIQKGNSTFDQNIAKRQLQEIEMTIFPNPTSDQIRITSVDQNGIGTINIYSNNGLLVYQKTENQQSHRIEIQDWKAGMYLIEMRNDKNEVVKSEKVIVIK